MTKSDGNDATPKTLGDSDGTDAGAEAGTGSGGPGRGGAGSPQADEPQDAATLIIVDSSAREPRILMGQRRKDLAFMPGKYVFPGGRVDKSDANIPCCHDLPALEISKLLLDMKGDPSETRARALALAALRETFEETGLLIGGPVPGREEQPPAPPPDDDAPANGSANVGADDFPAPSWQSFRTQGFLPRLDQMTYFARAITPPGRTRRYDTRFFCIDAAAISLDTGSRDAELLTLHWLTLEETGAFDLASITQVILHDLAERLSQGLLAAPQQPVPYYYFNNGSFQRELLGAR